MYEHDVDVLFHPLFDGAWKLLRPCDSHHPTRSTHTAALRLHIVRVMIMCKQCGAKQAARFDAGHSL